MTDGCYAQIASGVSVENVLRIRITLHARKRCLTIKQLINMGDSESVIGERATPCYIVKTDLDNGLASIRQYIVNTDSDNGLSSIRHKAITWPKADLLSIRY